MSNFFVLIHYNFMQNAAIAAIVASFLCGLMGYFIVVRQMAYAVHALGHISFSGACVALVMGVSPLVGQLGINLLAGLVIGLLGKSLLKNDMVISLALGLALGCGALFLSFYNHYAGAANALLFGDLLAVSLIDLKIIIFLTLLIVTILCFIARPLWLMSVAAEFAEAQGINIRTYNVIFFLLTAIVVAIASQIVGVLLVFILVIGPAAIAQQWTLQFRTGICLSMLISIILVFLALFLSCWNNWPTCFWLGALTFFCYLFGLVKGSIAKIRLSYGSH